MQRTFSIQRLNHSNSRPTLSKSPSARAIYINEQTNKKTLNTHFHSPFKQGKPNKQYVNPSFVSNHLFYPKDFIEKGQISVRHNLVPQQSDIKKEALYQQRLKTQSNQYSKIIQKQQQIRNKSKIQDNKTKGPRFLDANELLKKQLSTLQNYRQKNPNSLKENPSQNIPPYFQKRRKDNTYQQNFLQYKQKQMKNYINYNQQQKGMKKQQMQTQKQQQNQYIQKNILQFSKQNSAKQKLLKSKSNLLSTILKEQMQIQKRNKII